ncbi:ATP-binding protein [Aliterella atlantica]|uniref:histidine kinase n=1 Tax=Aliterella atlantica CENA595 TaxID=1618023 RepID=A0A0D8ZXU4_9CYAN|nr:ATP-binding protein [Aliterella atlantica]KJH72041.1 cyanobacterial phytochrome A [Aliterella atlantica CENA595]
MNDNQAIATETIDLTNCDREPIHIPGLIQPHGVLLVLQEPELKIIQVSANSDLLLGRSPEQLVNTALVDLLGKQQIQAIYQFLQADFENVNPLKIAIEAQNKTSFFDGIIHKFDSNLILELEPAKTENHTEFYKFYSYVKSTIDKLQSATNIEQICQDIVKEIRKLTQYDRVMVYQLDADGAGCVVAEDKRSDIKPYLGLHYPATDIPEQAKQLYTLNWLRLIPDVNYQSVKIIPQLNPVNNSPVDLSLAVLRSVSPIHIEYLQNMGVRASMCVSLMKDKQLWGLIACHHQEPKYISYEVRTACEFLGKVMSMQLVAKEENQDLDYKMKLKSIMSKFIESIGLQNNLFDGLVALKENLLELAGAQGVAICWDDEFCVAGKTPNPEQLRDLMQWIETKQDNLFHTNALSQVYPVAAEYSDVASGLIALAISRVNRNYILWFRPEVVQTVNWGGNPHKPLEVDEDGGLRLTPRKSFELWQETVRAKSLPWKPCELEAVLELRGAIVSIVLRQADELAKINIELERSNTELDAFAYIASHDLKEPLRGIHNYSNFLIEDYAQILNEEGVSKLQTLVRLTQRMEDLINSLLHFSRLGRVELAISATDLNIVVQQVLDLLSARIEETSAKIDIPRALPIINCDRVQVTEVFSNLISNAIKYSDRPQKWVEIGYLDAETESPIVFYVRDNGIGIKERYLDSIFRIFKRLHGQNQYGGGTGAGLTIVKKIVERHGGKIWVESTYGRGSTFYFTLQA